MTGIREELDTQTVCRAGRGTRHDQAVLSRRWQRAEEDLLGEVTRVAILALRSLPLHPDDGHAHQNVRYHSNQPR